MCNCKNTNRTRKIIRADRIQKELFLRDNTPVFGSGIRILLPKTKKINK